MALDEETRALLTRLGASGGRPLQEMTVEEARALTGELVRLGGTPPEMELVADGHISVSGGEIPYRLLVPRLDPRGVIVFFHGGGWVTGDIRDFERTGRVLAYETSCAVLLADYRLAPEYRFPTAVDDCYAALEWVDRQIAEIVGERVPIIVAGDSAGGNLAAVVAQRAKARCGPKIELQVLIYPVTDCDFESATYRDPGNQLLLTTESMQWFWDKYVPRHAARLHPDASPLRTPDAADLPPAVIVTAEHDVLRADGEMYAMKLKAAGVPVRHLRVAGQMHGFFTMIDVLPGSREAIQFVTEGITRRLASVASNNALPDGAGRPHRSGSGPHPM